MKLIFQIGFLIASLNAVAELSSQWTPYNLVGKANTHPGPDCHNATLVAKGYEDEIGTDSARQMIFYLDRFCHESSKPASAGDFVVVKDRDGFLAHTMLMLDDSNVFEKETGAGLFKSNDDGNPYYQIKKLEDSWYYVNKEKRHYSFSTYSCADAKTVRKEMQTCENRGEELGIKSIRQEFQKMAFSTSRDFYLSPEALAKVATFQSAIDQIRKPDECLEYFGAMIASIRSSVSSLESIGGPNSSKEWLAFSQRQQWLDAVEELSMSVDLAEGRVRFFEETGRLAPLGR